MSKFCREGHVDRTNPLALARRAKQGGCVKSVQTVQLGILGFGTPITSSEVKIGRICRNCTDCSIRDTRGSDPIFPAQSAKQEGFVKFGTF